MDQNGTTTQGRRTFPHGGNHFSKRRSESENENRSRRIVKIKIKVLKAKKTKRTRVKESWKVKADIAKDLKRPKTEVEKEIKRWQAKIEKFPALKDSILKFSCHLHSAAAFIIFKNLHFETSRIARSIFLYKL
jgi:hypothetical protein